MIDEKYPCKIIDFTVCKTGKHGPARKILTCIDLISDKKRIHSVTSGSMVPTFEITRESNLQIIGTDDRVDCFDFLKQNNLVESITPSNVTSKDREQIEKIGHLFEESDDTIFCNMLIISFGDTKIHRILDYRIERSP